MDKRKESFQKKIHIFFGDDDPEDVEFFQEALRELFPSVKITIAKDGLELLEFLQVVIPDMIFLDLNMPRMSGMECLRTIRENAGYKHIPVIIYSTSAEDRHIEEAYALGATRFVQKPLRYEDIKDRITLTIGPEISELLKRNSREDFVIN